MELLLQELTNNVDTTNDDIWKVCIAGDGSGELLLGEASVAIFDSKLELQLYVAALVSADKTLTLALIFEILREIQK